jgi:hypothetical protein
VTSQVLIGPSNDGRRHGRGTYLSVFVLLYLNQISNQIANLEMDFKSFEITRKLCKIRFCNIVNQIVEYYVYHIAPGEQALTAQDVTFTLTIPQLSAHFSVTHITLINSCLKINARPLQLRTRHEIDTY